MTRVARRAFAVGIALAIALGPMAGFLRVPGLPLLVHVSWAIALLGGIVAPVPSFIAFAAGSLLLPVVPSVAGWPRVSLVEQWALALLVPALLRAAWARSADESTSSPWAPVLALMVTASAFAAVAPLTVAHGGAWALVVDTFTFLRTNYVTESSQSHILASVAAWAVIVEGLGVFWLARRVVAARGRAPIVRAMAGAAVVVALVGIWQWWTGLYLLPFWLEYDPHLRRVNATFTDVNALGAYLATMLPVVLWRAGTASTRARRVTWGVGGLALVTANVFTASRVAWGAMLVGAAVLAWLAVRHGVISLPERRRTWVRRGAAGAGATLLALLLVLTAWGTLRDVRVYAQRSYLDPVLATLNLRAPLAERLKGRLAFWDAGFEMIAMRPLGGIGIGRFFKDVSRYASDPARLPRMQENAHNYFLQLAAEAGVPALLALLAIWAGAVAGARRDAGDPDVPTDERWAAIAAAAGLAAFAVTCLTGHSLLLREGQVATWVVAAVALGPPSRGRSPRATGWRAWAPLVVMLVVAASIVPRTLAALGAVDRTRVFEGLHDAEVWADGRSFRWTEREAVFHVPASATSVTFTLRSLAPRAQEVDILIDGKRVDHLALADHNWRVVRYLLPAKREQGYLAIGLLVEPTWQAPGDRRDLGVMLTGISWVAPETAPQAP